MRLLCDCSRTSIERRRRLGAASSNVLTYVVFALLAAAIVVFIVVGYRTYKKDMYLSTKVVSISMHDASQLQPTLYATKDPGDPVEKGLVTKIRKTAEPTMSVTEMVLRGLFAVMVLGLIAGFVMAAMGRWKIGKFVVGGAGAGIVILGLWIWYEATHRETLYEITLLPEVKGGASTAASKPAASKPAAREPISFAANSDTPVKIKNVDREVRSLQEGMKAQVTLTRDADEATKIVSPIPEEKPKKADAKKDDKKKDEVLSMLQLPEGFQGYAKRVDPKYMTSVELKENYLAQSYTVSRGAQTFQVSQVNRGALGFTAYARSLRLAALHDFKDAKLLEEGPTYIPGGKEVTWTDAKSPLKLDGTKVNAYALVVEGKDDNDKLVRCRQIAIQGEDAMMYVIKGTAPVSDWPAIGDVFDSAISTFAIAPVPEEKGKAGTQAATATAPTTQAAVMAEQPATAAAEKAAPKVEQ